MGAVGSRGRSQQSILQVVVKLLLFFAVCTLLTAYLAFTIGNIHVFEHTYKLTATFDDATGLAQCAELTWQLRGDAGERQVPGARTALQHNLGLGGAAVVTIYSAAN